MIARTARHFPLVIALAFALALVPAALAGKGGGGGKPSGGSTGGGSISGPIMVADVNTPGLSRGDEITFNVSTTATATPEVGVRCYQGATWVYDAYVGYFPSYVFDQWFTLQSNYWVDGVAATCNARLFYTDSRGRQNVLATTSFTVAP